MTKVKDTKQTFAEFASQMARNPDTLAQFTELMSDATRKREIGRRIKEERERRGLKQPQVAERAGVSGSPTNALRKYQNWEAGTNLPDHEQLERIAEVLGVSHDYLVTGGEQAPPSKDILARLDRIEEALVQISGRDASVRPSPTDDAARAAEEALPPSRAQPKQKRQTKRSR